MSGIVLGKNNKVFCTYRGCGMDVLICWNLSSAPPCEVTTTVAGDGGGAPRVFQSRATSSVIAPNNFFK